MLKLTSTRKSIAEGSPSRTVGSYLLFETALSAAGISNAGPLIARIPVTLPCSSMIASITTAPAIRSAFQRNREGRIPEDRARSILGIHASGLAYKHLFPGYAELHLTAYSNSWRCLECYNHPGML